MKVYLKRDDSWRDVLSPNDYKMITDNGNYVILDVTDTVLSKVKCWRMIEPVRKGLAFEVISNGKFLVTLLCSPFFNGDEEWKKCFEGISVLLPEGFDFKYIAYVTKTELLQLLRNKCVYCAEPYVPTINIDSPGSPTEIVVSFFNDAAMRKGQKMIKALDYSFISDGSKNLRVLVDNFDFKNLQETVAKIRNIPGVLNLKLGLTS
jgi:hypothetical protein